MITWQPVLQHHLAEISQFQNLVLVRDGTCWSSHPKHWAYDIRIIWDNQLVVLTRLRDEYKTYAWTKLPRHWLRKEFQAVGPKYPHRENARSTRPLHWRSPLWSPGGWVSNWLGYSPILNQFLFHPVELIYADIWDAVAFFSHLFISRPLSWRLPENPLSSLHRTPEHRPTYAHLQDVSVTKTVSMVGPQKLWQGDYVCINEIRSKNLKLFIHSRTIETRLTLTIWSPSKRLQVLLGIKWRLLALSDFRPRWQEMGPNFEFGPTALCVRVFSTWGQPCPARDPQVGLEDSHGVGENTPAVVD